MSRSVNLLAGLLLMVGLTGCSAEEDPKAKPTAESTMSSTKAFDSACKEVRAGVVAYNPQEFGQVQPHFVRATPFAKMHAKKSDGKDADELLEAIEFFAEVPPAGYTANATSLKLFEKYKAITLGDCFDEEPGDGTGQET